MEVPNFKVVLECYEPILMHIYGIQCDFIHGYVWQRERERESLRSGYGWPKLALVSIQENFLPWAM